MQDHYLVEKDGTRTATADLPTWQIIKLLRGRVKVVQDANVTEDQIMERLRIELVARSLTQR